MIEHGVFTPEKANDDGLGLSHILELEPIGDINPQGRLNFPNIRRFLPKGFARFAAPAAMAVSAAVYGGAVCGEEAPKASDLQKDLKYSLTLPFGQNETWWYTGGPHSDGLSGGVRYAIDLTPAEEPMVCPGSDPYVVNPVRAIADGVVSIVGNENNQNDKNHSVVEIGHDGDFTSGYMHLDEMQVMVGQQVGRGDILGYVSCEFPPGGDTDGEHLHFYGKIKDRPIEVDRIVMSGWTIEESSGNYQGTMYQNPDDLRTADTRRCGPIMESILACEGIRNDVRWSEYDAALAPTVEPVATLAPVPTLDPVFVDPISPPWRQPMSPPWEGDFNSPPNESSDTTDGGGVISALGWEFRINSWGTEPDYDYGAVSVLHEGWKRVVVVGDLVNPSGSAKNTADIVRLFNTYDVYKFTVEGNGADYEADLGRVEGYNSRSWKPMGMLNEVSVPGGLSIPFVIVAEVPNNVADYQLNLRDMRDGTHVAGPVGKGDIYSKASGSADGAENGQKLEDCVVSGYARISYIGNVLYSASSMTTGNFQEQFLIFDVTNLSGRDIPANYGRGGIEVSVFTADGGITEGSEYFYTEQYTRVMKIAPGLTREVGTVIGTDGADAIVANRLVDLDGATVSLTIWDGNRTPSNCKWKLP